MFYGEYRIAAGMKETFVNIRAPMTVLDILTQIAHLTPQLTAVLSEAFKASESQDFVVIAINGKISDLKTIITSGDEIKLLPPLIGGSGG
jgi:molybdopterin converting factor small subunit